MSTDITSPERFREALADHVGASDTINAIISRVTPLFQVSVELPQKITDNTIPELFAKASLLRSNLDSLTNFLSGVLLVHLQVKKALVSATMLYKDSISEVVKAQYTDIKAAKGYEEREQLARSRMDKTVVANFDFWSETLSNLVDVIEIIRGKMSMFKGGLDTILSMIALLKIQASLRGLTLDAGTFDHITEKALSSSTQNEGTVQF